MAEPQTTNHLTNCPRCGYSVCGLPTEHRCPECGFNIDLRWRIFGAKYAPEDRKRPHRIIIYVVTACVMPVIFTWFVGVPLAKVPAPTSWIISAILTIICVRIGYSFFGGTKNFIAVGPKELVIYYHPHMMDCHKWETVGKSFYDIRTKTVAIVINGRTRHLSARKFFGNNVCEAEACTSYIKQFARG